MNINPRGFYRLNLILLVLLCLLVFDRCRDKDPGVYGVGLDKRIKAYNNLKSPNSANTKKGNPALYIDFSSGINNAFKDPVISRLMSECFNTVLTDKFEVYKLGSNQVTPFVINNTTELGEKVSDPKQYLDIFAPIQTAVEKITNGDNDALLITDFEEWQNNIQITNTAYLKIPFSKWLTKGNTIHFFIADYKEGKIDKHIYFTIFNCGNPNSSSLITKLETKLAPLERFDLSTSAYKLSTNYPSEKSGGVFYDKNGKTAQAQNVLDLKENYVNGLKDGHFYEFYPLGLDWKTIDETHDAYKKENQFSDIFRNLFIDLSNKDSYSYVDFGVKTYDISNDFENYSKSVEVVNHMPRLTKGDNGEAKFADDEKDEIALNCYNPNGSIKDECKYKPQVPVAISEFFVLNGELFKNTEKSDIKKTELGVSFDPKFNIKNLSNQDGLLKVDIVLNTAEPKVNNPKLDKFKWLNEKGIPNVALYESIKNTLQELKPNNKVIYSYYIKTNQL